MKAMILAGGMGTRLRPLTFSIPKPLLPVGEKPILQKIIEQLREAGVTDLILATGYQAELVRAFCGDGSKFGVSVTYIHEHQPLGTAGPAGALKGQIPPSELLLLMNGDLITDLDFRDSSNPAAPAACDLTVAYAKYIYRSPYGVLSIADGVGARRDGKTGNGIRHQRRHLLLNQRGARSHSRKTRSSPCPT